MTQCEHKGELEHRRVKRFYARTNKIKFARGIAKQQRRERLLYKLRQKAQNARDTDSHLIVNFSEQEVLPQCSPESQYQISDSRRLHWDLTAWLHKNREDLAVKACSCLFSHLFSNFCDVGLFTAPQRSYSYSAAWF
jgi:hypothetical protein